MTTPASGTTAFDGSATGNRSGALYMLLSVLLFSVMDTTVKYLGDFFPTAQIILFRCAVALGPILVFIHLAGGLHILRTKRPGVHFLRSAIGLAAMGSVFWAFSQMRLADAITIFFSAPLMMTALSVPLLGEKVGIRRWSAVCVGFVGVIIVVNPSMDFLDGGAAFNWGVAAALVGAFLMALAMIVVRRLSRTDHAASITFYFTITGSVIGGLWTWWEGWVDPTPLQWALLIGVGIFGAFAQYTMTLAFRNAEVTIIAPLEYTSIVYTSILAYIVWAEVPGLRTFIGAAVIIGSGLYMLHREARLSAKPARRIRLPRLRGRT